MSQRIDSFREKYRFLSNFWPCQIRFAKLDFPSVEHAYQAAKSTNPLDWEVIRNCSTSGKAKKMGNQLELRPGWDRSKLYFMDFFLHQKFCPESELADRLLATGNQELVEGNWWGDTYWGRCDGKGQNNLGKLLMKIRDKLHTININTLYG